MPESTVNDQTHQNSQFFYKSTSQIKTMSRQTVIKIGVNTLREVGADYICKVCITNGGSCCNGCRHLANGIGCQQRNTSCTAWLCGFLKYLLYETGLLQELAKTHIAIGFILTLREKIDKNIDRLDASKHNPKKKTKIIRNIKFLSSSFHRFQKELRDYHQKYPNI